MFEKISKKDEELIKTPFPIRDRFKSITFEYITNKITNIKKVSVADIENEKKYFNEYHIEKLYSNWFEIYNDDFAITKINTCIVFMKPIKNKCNIKECAFYSNKHEFNCLLYKKQFRKSDIDNIIEDNSIEIKNKIIIINNLVNFTYWLCNALTNQCKAKNVGMLKADTNSLTIKPYLIYPLFCITYKIPKVISVLDEEYLIALLILEFKNEEKFSSLKKTNNWRMLLPNDIKNKMIYRKLIKKANKLIEIHKTSNYIIEEFIIKKGGK